MLSHKKVIGIFDSGLGGLTIAKKVLATLPHIDIIYLADHANFPYGSKSTEAIQKFSFDNLSFLEKNFSPDIFCVACNTASTHALDHLRQTFKKPIVGVVPAIKPAAQKTKTKVIAVLATPKTIQGEYLDDLIQQFAQGITVIRCGSQKLVELSEKKIRGQTISLSEINHEVASLLQHSEIDTIVLGCTHFPILLSELQSFFPSHVQFLDSSTAIAERIAFLFNEKIEAEKKISWDQLNDRIKIFQNESGRFVPSPSLIPKE